MSASCAFSWTQVVPPDGTAAGIVRAGVDRVELDEFQRTVNVAGDGFLERTFTPETAPGEVARITAARIVDEDGKTVDAVDVRRPVGVEIAFDVLRPGTALFPKIKIVNAQAEIAFNALDTNPRWRKAAKPGKYVSTAWIPANLLNEGMVSVDVGLASMGAPKLVHHVNLPGVLTFHAQDPGEGDSAKGLFTGQLRGVVRPLLEWTSRSD